jgi:hypothetical protein
MPAQAAEQLLKIGQGNILALADAGQGDGTPLVAQAKINHRRDGKTPFSGQPHDSPLEKWCSVDNLQFPIVLVN